MAEDEQKTEPGKVHVIPAGEVKVEVVSRLHTEPARAVHYFGATPGDALENALRAFETVLKNLPAANRSTQEPPAPMEPVAWLEVMIRQRKPDEIPAQFARRMKPLMDTAHKAGEVKRAWAARTIETRISGLDLWPK